MHRLTSLAWDILTDLAEDTHGSWEVFGFVRAHFPNADDAEVFRIGRSLIATWLADGWRALAVTPLAPTSIRALEEVLPHLDAAGPASTRFVTGAPSFDLSAQGQAAVHSRRHPTPPGSITPLT